MELTELLGTETLENVTVDQIQEALSGKKFVDLSSGKYVNKDMAEANQRKANEQIKDLQAQLDSKLTDDERRAKEVEEKDSRIEELTKEIEKIHFNANREKMSGAVKSTRDRLGIKEDDKDYNNFIDLITLKDSKNNATVCSYLEKMLTDAYQRGVDDTTKSQIASSGSLKSGDVGKAKEMNYGERLAKGQVELQKEREAKGSSYFK